MQIYSIDKSRANVVKWIDARSAGLLMRIIRNREQKNRRGFLPAFTLPLLWGEPIFDLNTLPRVGLRPQILCLVFGLDNIQKNRQFVIAGIF
jgi:hypothetical protein